MRMAKRYDKETKEYKQCQVKDDCEIFDKDYFYRLGWEKIDKDKTYLVDRVVSCATCKKKMNMKHIYASKYIVNPDEMPFGICKNCFAKEHGFKNEEEFENFYKKGKKK